MSSNLTSGSRTSAHLDHQKWVSLTVDGEFCRPAAAAGGAADGVAGHAAVGASVLLLHGADEQR